MLKISLTGMDCWKNQLHGPTSYMIELLNGMTVRRHVDSIRKRESSNPGQDSDANMQGSELIRVPVELTAVLEDPELQSQKLDDLPKQELDASPPLRRLI